VDRITDFLEISEELSPKNGSITPVVGEYARVNIRGTESVNYENRFWQDRCTANYDLIRSKLAQQLVCSGTNIIIDSMNWDPEICQIF
jgi:hypothetical protein